ncbi:MAG: ATP-binding protein [Deltaproteobacteria bacterium]|nr:ATP-binding protein [Deltaproteobacteria bacterium]
MKVVEGLGVLVLVLVVAGALVGVITLISNFLSPQTLRRKLEKWLGPKFLELETHEKTFPGYDLASVHRALESLLDETCTRRTTEGAATMPTIRELFAQLRATSYAIRSLATSFERVPIDVDDEASFPTNQLWLVELPGARGPIRAAVLLGTRTPGWQDFDGIEGQVAPTMAIAVSIAVSEKEVADRFFRELEERRRTHSIFRGKVIDPVVDAGGVRTIGFRALRPVPKESLVLPERVRVLLESSVLRFYAHRAMLDRLGVEKKRGILFHGPPGTGKTSVCLWLAKELSEFTICFVSGQRLLYPRELAKMARYLQPSMLVFEDIDLIAEQRDSNGLATVLGELMNQIDGCEPNEEVLFVMNTNSLDRLESAVRNRPGRVDQIIEIPPPAADERRRLFELFAASVKLEVTDWDRILDLSRGMTPAMIKEIVKRAIVSRVASLSPPENGVEPSLGLTDGDLALAAEQVKLLRSALPGAAADIGFQRSS